MRKRKLIIFIIFVLLGLITESCSIAAHVIYKKVFARVEGFSEDGFHTYIAWKEIDQTKYSREEVHFKSGKNQLQGFIYGGMNDKGLVIISHGIGGTANEYLPMVMFFVDKGWRVLAFNNTGVSGSEGKNMRGLTQSVIDLDAALTYIENSSTLSSLPIMLAGHSWGGYAVCAVLNYDHRVNAAVSFAGFNNGPKIFKEQGVSFAHGFYHLLSPYFGAMQRTRFGKTMKLTAVDGINKAGIPVMIVHSSDDKMIPSNTTSIYAHRDKITNPNARIIYLDSEDAAGHEYVFCSKEKREYMKLANSNWQAYKAEYDSASLSQWAEEFNFDKLKANELNGELMEQINLFFMNAKIMEY
jgi:pimeloyl-ACP methyl ester carboxylesterase